MRRVKTTEDALLWLAYWGRYLNGDLGRHCRQVCRVVLRMRDDLDEARGRAARLAAALEAAEAKVRKQEQKP